MDSYVFTDYTILRCFFLQLEDSVSVKQIAVVTSAMSLNSQAKGTHEGAQRLISLSKEVGFVNVRT